MKILMTGMTTRTVGSQRLKLDYLNFNPLLKKALQEIGHVVEQRRITVDETMEEYDLGFIHVTPGDKIVCQNVLEVCSALQKMKGRAIVFLEDWIAVEFRNAWYHILHARWDAWKKWKLYQWTAEEDLLVRSTILELLNGDSWPIIANFYGWGQPREFFEKNFATRRTMVVDPSSMAAIPKFEAKPKEYRWILATLQKHDKWVGSQGFTWPIECFGNERQGHPAISEQEVTQRYAESWGVLAPRYPVVGWFRPRFLLAAATGAVLYCDPSEGRFLGPAYQVPVRQIESMSLADLSSLADYQKSTFSAKIWPKERLFGELEGLMAAMVGTSLVGR